MTLIDSMRKAGVVAVALIIFVAGFLWIMRATTIQHLTDNLLTAYLIGWGILAMWARTPRTELAKRFVLMTGTLAALLLLIEAPAWQGYVDYRRIFSITEGFETWDKPGFVPVEEVLWLHPPYYRMKGRYSRGDIGKALCFIENDSRAYDSRYDRNGFRNESDLDAADIAVVGDSFVEAMMLPSSELLTSVLGQLENSTVANLGVAGYGPQQELGVLKKHAMNLHPKTIVWFFYEGNDLEDAREYETKAGRFPKDGNRTYRLFQRSFTSNAMRAFLRTKRGCNPSRDLERRFGTIQDPQGLKHRMYFAYPIQPLTKSDLEALEKVRAALVEGYRLCRERGIRLIVVFGPTEYRVYNGLSNLVEVAEEVKSWEINDLPDRLRNVVSGISSDIVYVDLTTAFKKEAARGTRIFLTDDTHWSSAGHQVVAQTLHNVLSSLVASAK